MEQCANTQALNKYYQVKSKLKKRMKDMRLSF